MTAAQIFRLRSGGAVLEVAGEREFFCHWRAAVIYAKRARFVLRLPSSGVPEFLPTTATVLVDRLVSV